MITYCSSQTGTLFGWLAGRYQERIGNLFSTDGKFTPWRFAPYALDNGAYPAWKNKQEWDEVAWLRLIDRAARCPIQPQWVLVPDVVADKERTLAKWQAYYAVVEERGFVPAFAVQDGMLPCDVPEGAEVVFVGGSTDWKWQTVQIWCDHFSRVHVGRVNTIHQLRRCYEAGAESTDGTGWFRGDDRQLNGLIQFYEETLSAEREKCNLDSIRRPLSAGSYYKYRVPQCGTGKVEQLRMF